MAGTAARHAWRLALRFLVLSNFALGLAGCGRAPDERTADGRVIVHYWEKWTGFESDSMQAVVDDFNASQKCIFVEKLTVSEVDRKLLLATAGGNPPDVAGLWSSDICGFAEKNALEPLDRRLRAAGIGRDHYIPVFWDLCAYRGFMWALPSTPSSLALHWNKKMFRDAGLDPERPPRSLAELEAMSDRLTIVDVVRSNQTVRLRYVDLTDPEKAAHEFRLVQVGHLPQEPGWWMPLWAYWFGGNLTEGERKITALTPENLRTFGWFHSVAEKYGVENLRGFGASFGNFASPQNPFLSGRVAMVLQGVWMYNFIDKYAPQLEWGAAPFPAEDPVAHPNVTIAECDVLVIPRGARHPAEGFEFMRYINSQGPMEKLALGQRKFSPLAVTSDAFLAAHPNPFIRTFIALARSPNARTVPCMSVWTEYNDEMRVAADRVTALQATPAEALGDVQQRIQHNYDRVLHRWDLVKDARIKEWRDDDAR